MAVNNMNKVTLQKYGFSPAFVEEKALNDKTFRLVKVQKYAERYKHSDIQSDKRFCKKFRSPLEIGKKVLALAERLKKKQDAPGALHKSMAKNMSFCKKYVIF